MFTLSLKPSIWQFHVVTWQTTSKNCTFKCVPHAKHDYFSSDHCFLASSTILQLSHHLWILQCWCSTLQLDRKERSSSKYRELKNYCCAQALVKTANVAISLSCFAEDGTELFSKACRTCSTLTVYHSTYQILNLWCRISCCHRGCQSSLLPGPHDWLSSRPYGKCSVIRNLSLAWLLFAYSAVCEFAVAQIRRRFYT